MYALQVAVMDGTRLAVQHMCSNKGGTIVNVSSMSAFLPIPTAPMYAATKAAVNQLTRCAPRVPFSHSMCACRHSDVVEPVFAVQNQTLEGLMRVSPNR
jgi:short-subunit dehydrogenase involved in D-alanine esterification of teichoic acids